MDISILLPVYNRDYCIKKCIESCLKQDFQGNYEIIIIDDGSTDNTIKEIESIKDNKIRLFKRDHQKLVSALNFGLTKCNGKYIARMDSDDIMLPFRLQYQYDFIEKNPQYDIICSTTILSKKFKYKFIHTGEILLKDELINNKIHHPTVMFKKSLNLKYNPEYEYCEDYELWLRCLSEGMRIYNLEKPTVITNSNIDQITKKYKNETSKLAKKCKEIYK